VHGHEVVHVFVDAGLSGKAMDHRPDLLKALAMVKAGLVDGIVVASLSRLSRSMADLSALIRDHFQPRKGKGRRAAAALISVSEAFDTGSPAGRAMCQLLGVFAELEREMTSARCYDSAQHNKAQGRCVGTCLMASGRSARRATSSASSCRTSPSSRLSGWPNACERRDGPCWRSATSCTALAT
jgi:DNA invertase Pin-like site-specific DNA recombinase